MFFALRVVVLSVLLGRGAMGVVHVAVRLAGLSAVDAGKVAHAAQYVDDSTHDGPIKFKTKFAQGEDVFRQRRSLLFKKMQIVRGCDAKRNVLVYMVYSDKLIEGSPKNSTSSVPIMPWGAADAAVQKCGEFIQ